MTSLKTTARDVVDLCLAYRSRKLSRAVTRIFNDELRPLGLNIAEMNLLVAIAAYGEMQPSKLAQAMELEKSTLSRDLKRMTTRGWVRVAPNPDGRGVIASLREPGELVLRSALPAWERAQVEARSLVSELIGELRLT